MQNAPGFARGAFRIKKVYQELLLSGMPLEKGYDRNAAE
jgi:hypothetical protein